MTVAIRPVRASDIPAITSIYAHAVEHGTASFELHPPDTREMSRRMELLLADDYPYFVAEADGVICGYAYAGPYRTRPAYRWTLEDSVYIAPGAQRQGHGRALLQAVIEASEARNFRQMIAVIGDSVRQKASIGLHEALGFRRAGLLESVGHKHGRWLDSLLMQRILGHAATTPP
ncbi:MAG TPA: GNAT family N-acetyltransferase [Pseudolabrys sp.]|nr:GNAT family N-acetyltransferase [Pseudolabrys sp.]